MNVLRHNINAIRALTSDSILHNECREGNLYNVRKLLTTNAVNVNKRGLYGWPPLLTAAWCGDTDMLDCIMNKGGDVSVVDYGGDNILHVACNGGNEHMVNYVLSMDIVDVNSRGQCGRTPVMVAALGGHQRMVTILLNEGADLSCVDDEGSSMLHVACCGGDVETVKYVLSRGYTRVDGRNRNGWTALMCAAWAGQRGAFDALVSAGCDVSAVDNNGNTILHVACLGGNVDIVKYVLVDISDDVNCRGQYGWTPVMIAAGRGYRGLFDFLVSKDVDLSLVGDDGNTILHMACLGGDVEIVQYVLREIQMDINVAGHEGITPVMIGARTGNQLLFDLLVSKGADVSIIDHHRNNVLHMACTGGDDVMVTDILLLKQFSIKSRGQNGMTPIMFASRRGHVGVFDVLLSQKDDVSVKDDDGNNILHLASLGGDDAMTHHVLIETSIDINSRGKLGRTPVMLAAQCGHKGVFDVLWNTGADVSLFDDEGNTALHLACSGGNDEMVHYILLHTKFDVNSRGKCGRTPVMVAAEFGHRGVFDILLRQGCDLSLIDDDGNTIHHVAAIGGHVDVMKYLVSQDIEGANAKNNHGSTAAMISSERQ
ncbi:ankyrin repeat domain-containing protein 50-like isoform X2 [Haliotis rufescens]|nr:ankyrin repeat domain-containing protein 50-like isoform X2 [Haliotis rufescens]XP_046378653.2 ankyrin repeat domain-containing protein 50-like isoform X2 [Haliotis rufescens]XP_046378670.2 ankyrin repeat domain-containing protein 50-like isoform X2 [Haliotis rufescens]XP_046378679.2 ankyrin repeat domain-containing protein 50-like isoform X2 [Haliotis rufescens]XP_048238452.1 ankyrin repeat domain-containing protein 50-like isoform X2 [Haliotis rufescens]